MRAKVASVHFHHLKAEYPTFGGYYEIPAVPLNGEPFILELSEKIELSQGPYETSQQKGKREQRRTLITPDTIATELVRVWTQNRIGCNHLVHPGVWQVRERIPVLDGNGVQILDIENRGVFQDATPEQIESMFAEDLAAARSADAGYANYLIGEGNSKASDPRGNLIPFISAVARAAAKTYRPEVTWLREGAGLEMKTCPYCTQPCPATAIKCPRCLEVVDMEAFATLEARKAEYLRIAKEKNTRAQREAIQAPRPQVQTELQPVG